MTVTQYVPIASSGELEEAIGIVRRLLQIADRGTERGVLATISVASHHGLERLYPPGWRPSAVAVRMPPDCVDRVTEHAGLGSSGSREPDGTVWKLVAADRIAALDGLEDLPIRVQFDVEEPETPDFPWSLLAHVGTDRAMIIWHLAAWPSPPHLDMHVERKHPSVMLAMNCRPWAMDPDDGYHVHVGTGPWRGEERRVAWLAEQVGCAIEGPTVWP